MKKLIVPVIVVLLMVGFGFGVNRFLANSKSKLIETITHPQQQAVAVNLPGTVYLTQDGTLYALKGGRFTQIISSDDGANDWIMPAVDGPDLLVVNRQADYSDAYVYTTSGTEVAQITHDAGPQPVNPNNIYQNQWIFWPHVLPGGQNIIASYDYPKDGYEVDFSLWQNPIDDFNIPDSSSDTDQWTTPDPYTGGDTTPQPLANGGVIFSHYELEDVSGNEDILSVLGYQPNAPAATTYLTTYQQNCSQPDISPNQTEVAMICTNSTSNGVQLDDIEVAAIEQGGAALGPVKTVVSQCLCAYPTWSPSGNSLIYLAPQGVAGPFQLWYVAAPMAQKVKAPVLVTPPQNGYSIDFDATSPPLWAS